MTLLLLPNTKRVSRTIAITNQQCPVMNKGLFWGVSLFVRMRVELAEIVVKTGSVKLVLSTDVSVSDASLLVFEWYSFLGEVSSVLSLLFGCKHTHQIRLDRELDRSSPLVITV